MPRFVTSSTKYQLETNTYNGRLQDAHTSRSAVPLSTHFLSEPLSHDPLLHSAPFQLPARPQQKYDYFRQSLPRIRHAWRPVSPERLLRLDRKQRSISEVEIFCKGVSCYTPEVWLLLRPLRFVPELPNECIFIPSSTEFDVR